MSYIKLKVRSGGIYIRQKKDFQPIGLDLMTHPENKGQKVLSLVRDSSIKGIFSYLMGETKKIKEIANNTELSIKNLNLSLDKMVQASAYKKISEPHITTFYERKDVHTKQIVFDSKINLGQHTFKTADPTIKLFKKPLKNIFKTESLGEINKGLQNSKIINTNPEYSNLKPPDCKNIPSMGIGQKMRIYFEKCKKKDKPIYGKTIELISETNSICLKDIKFKKNLENSKHKKFSVFEMPSQTRHWVDEKYHKIVRGAPAFLACADFDIYLSDGVFTENQSSNHVTWEEIIDKIKKGPNIARWGEGGIVFVDYSGLDEIGCPQEGKDTIFVEMNALRKAEVKIKKYDWEEKEEGKNPKTKNNTGKNIE